MAITKLMHMKQAKKGKPSTHLKNAIKYILRPDKVLGGGTPQAYVGTVNCTAPASAYKEMMKTKKYYGKQDGRQGYHFILSFRPGEVTPEQCFRITEGFIQEYFQGEYEVVYALHSDKPHLHTHIIFNSVNFATGLKYHYANGDWQHSIQPIVDRLCMAEGVPVLEYHIDEYQDEDEVRTKKLLSGNSWKQQIKKDIDAVIKESSSWEEFVQNMKSIGYQINYQNRKYVTVKKEGMERGRRLTVKTMGEMYTPDAIIERILSRKSGFGPPAGVIRRTREIRDAYARKPKFIPYKEMNFYERVKVRQMMRIRKALPEYRNSPGDWYVKVKKEELHRLEQQLAVQDLYSICSTADVKNVLEALQKRLADIREAIHNTKLQEYEYREIIAAYQAGNPLEPYGTTREAVQDFLAQQEKNLEKLQADQKETRKHIAVLKRMQKEEEEPQTPEAPEKTTEQQQKQKYDRRYRNER